MVCLHLLYCIWCSVFLLDLTRWFVIQLCFLLIGFPVSKLIHLSDNFACMDSCFSHNRIVLFVIVCEFHVLVDKFGSFSSSLFNYRIRISRIRFTIIMMMDFMMAMYNMSELFRIIDVCSVFIRFLKSLLISETFLSIAYSFSIILIGLFISCLHCFLNCFICQLFS